MTVAAFCGVAFKHQWLRGIVRINGTNNCGKTKVNVILYIYREQDLGAVSFGPTAKSSLNCFLTRIVKLWMNCAAKAKVEISVKICVLSLCLVNYAWAKDNRKRNNNCQSQSRDQSSGKAKYSKCINTVEFSALNPFWHHKMQLNSVV